MPADPPALPAPLAARLAAFARGRPPRAGSLVITLFGDAVLPRGGAAALDGVRRALAPFGINVSQLRTAVSRLVADGWLEGAGVAGRGAGRRAVYALTADGRRRAEEATWRIYAGPPPRRAGTWTLATLRGHARARRAAPPARLARLRHARAQPRRPPGARTPRARLRARRPAARRAAAGLRRARGRRRRGRRDRRRGVGSRDARRGVARLPRFD